MDTKEIEHNKGATADFLQQKKNSCRVCRLKDSRCFFRLGETGCRHLNDWTAFQDTLWSAA